MFNFYQKMSNFFPSDQCFIWAKYACSHLYLSSEPLKEEVQTWTSIFILIFFYKIEFKKVMPAHKVEQIQFIKLVYFVFKDRVNLLKIQLKLNFVRFACITLTRSFSLFYLRILSWIFSSLSCVCIFV